MKNFTIQLRPPADSLTYHNTIMVYLDNLDNQIGVCHLDRTVDGRLIGDFELHEDVNDDQFILYLFNLNDITPHMYGIFICNTARDANTIGNTRVK